VPAPPHHRRDAQTLRTNLPQSQSIQRHADEGNRRLGEGLQGFARQRGVDKLTHDLRREDPQADAAEHEGSQQDKASLLWADGQQKSHDAKCTVA
jgi:hypothetical protein